MFLRASSVLVLLALVPTVYGQALPPPYNTGYSLTSLGSVPGVPTNYGGVCFLDNMNLLLGGHANIGTGVIFQVPIIRGAGNHITSFGAAPSLYKNAPYIDGGLAFGPGGVLIAVSYDIGNPSSANGNQMYQYKPGGGLNPDKIISMAPLGVNQSTGSLQFVAAGFPGAGGLRILSYGLGGGAGGGQIYSATLTPDGLGTFNLGGVTLQTTLPGAPGPQGIIYVPAGSPVFNPANQYALISEYIANRVSAYQLDAAGYPIGATQSTFVTGLSGAEGACLDPLTNDLVFSTFGVSNQLIVVSGFPPPPPPPPSPPVGGGGGGSPGTGAGEGSFAGCHSPPSPGSSGSFGLGSAQMTLVPAQGAPTGPPVLLGPYLGGSGAGAPSPVAPGFASAPPGGTNLQVFNVSHRQGQSVPSGKGGSTLGWVTFSALAVVVAVVLVKQAGPAC